MRLIFLSILFSFQVAFSQDTIYTEDFSDGFNNGWESRIPNNGPRHPHWEWRGPETEPYDVFYPLDGPCSFRGNDVDDLPFLTQENGYMVLDGNRNDMGTEGEVPCAGSSIGLGEYPGPFSSFLESPFYDLSLIEYPVLSFYLDARHLDTDFFFEYSLDSGNTWETMLNFFDKYGEEIAQRVEVNLSQIASKHSHFKFRLHYEGAHYHAMVDDVTIQNQDFSFAKIAEVQADSIEVVKEQYFYQLPLSQARNLNPYMIFQIWANRELNVDYKLTIKDPLGQTFTDSTSAVLQPLLVPVLDTISFSEYLPTKLGDYTLTFDVVESNNGVIASDTLLFEITEGLYSPDGLDKQLSYFYPPYLSVGPYYSEEYQTFYSYNNSTAYGIEFIVSNHSNLVANGVETLPGDTLEFSVYEVTDLKYFNDSLIKGSFIDSSKCLKRILRQSLELSESNIYLDEFIPSIIRFNTPLNLEKDKLYLYSILASERVYRAAVGNGYGCSDFSNLQSGYFWRSQSEDFLFRYSSVNSYLKLIFSKSYTDLIFNQENHDFLEVFPNPSDDVINIRINNKETIQSISLFQTDGRLIKKLKVNGIGNAVFPVDEVNTGNYILELNTSNGIVRRSVAIQN